MAAREHSGLLACLRRLAGCFYPARLRSKITLVVVIGLLLAQVLTGTMWSQLRSQVLIETPARIAAVRFSDWYLYAESQLARGLEIDPALLSGVSAAPVPRDSPVLDASAEDAGLGTFFEQSIRERTGAHQNFQLLGADRKPAGQPEDGVSWLRALSLERSQADIAFAAIFRLSDGQYWRLQVVESPGWNAIGKLPFTYDYFFRIYFFRLLLVVLALTLCLHFIFRPLKRLEKIVANMDINVNQQKIQLGGSEEFKRLGTAFNDMAERVQKHIEERSHFFSAVSHDLRTPLTRLKLRIQQVGDAELNQSLNRDVEQLNELVHSTLELMSFQTSDEHFAEVDVAALLDAISINRQELGERISLGERDPAILRIQIQGLRRCLENLMSNGLRYGDHVYVSARGTPQEYIITIADDGPGIPAEEQARVLRPYYRLESSRNRATGGYGLGLSICDEVIRAHGGRLFFGHQEQRFCVFLCLPLHRSQVATHARTGAAPV